MIPVTEGVVDIKRCPFVCLSVCRVPLEPARPVRRPCDSRRRRAIKRRGRKRWRADSILGAAAWAFRSAGRRSANRRLRTAKGTMLVIKCVCFMSRYQLEVEIYFDQSIERRL